MVVYEEERRARANMQNTQAAAGREIVTKNHFLGERAALSSAIWPPHPRARPKCKTLNIIYIMHARAEEPKAPRMLCD